MPNTFYNFENSIKIYYPVYFILYCIQNSFIYQNNWIYKHIFIILIRYGLNIPEI